MLLRNARHVVDSRAMPELDHWPGKSEGSDWVPERSEVIQWLMKQPSVASWIVTHLRDRGAIKYNAETGKWVGLGVESSEVNTVALG